MNIFDVFETNKNLETEGVWIDYELEGKVAFSIKIARAGGNNIDYLKSLETIGKKFNLQLKNDTLDALSANKLMMEVYAEVIVKDWKNIKDKSGKELKCNKENIIMLFEKLPDFYKDIVEQAQKIATFRQKEQEENLGNS